MSTFCGYFEDLKYVSVDRFDGSTNLESNIYFLSHCHTDHMVGLDKKSFQDRLLNNAEIFLYASAMSVRILTGLYPHLACKFRSIPVKHSILIENSGNATFLAVTAIPAGHCPGSVMFLFESDKNILYTGDIRLNAEDLAKYNTLFHQADKIKKRIDVMYLDTTFLSRSHFKFPSRSDSLRTLMQLIEDWISGGPYFVINLITSAKYGHEYLFSELSKGLKMPIHVNEEIYHFYKYIPDMDNVITRDGTRTQIHASCMGYKKTCIGHQNNSEQYKIRSIKTCAMSFTNFQGDNFHMYDTKSDFYRVCYSCHSSYEELVDFIHFFQPLQIKASVIPDNIKERENLHCNINKILAELNISKVSKSKKLVESTLSGNLFKVAHKKKPAANDNKQELTDINEDFLLDSPPRESNKRLRF